jgi:hypothetical protein
MFLGTPATLRQWRRVVRELLPASGRQARLWGGWQSGQAACVRTQVECSFGIRIGEDQVLTRACAIALFELSRRKL